MKKRAGIALTAAVLGASGMLSVLPASVAQAHIVCNHVTGTGSTTKGTIGYTYNSY